MLTPYPHVVAADDLQKKLRDLNNEHRETVEALNHAQASIVRALKLNDQNYHRKRKAILSATQSANGHDETESI
jgi:hypothetical protein